MCRPGTTSRRCSCCTASPAPAIIGATRSSGCRTPDLLGYGDTDMPGELDRYQLRLLGGDVAELLQKVVGAMKVIGVSHDW